MKPILNVRTFDDFSIRFLEIINRKIFYRGCETRTSFYLLDEFYNFYLHYEIKN